MPTGRHSSNKLELLGKSGNSRLPSGLQMRVVMKSHVLRRLAILNILFTGKSSMREILVTVPQTDTGELVEYTKVYELSLVKEFGKILP